MTADFPKIVIVPVEHRTSMVYAKHDTLGVGERETRLSVTFPQPDRDGYTTASLSDNEHVGQAITRDPETMHGVPVFHGTRVPVQTLFEYLEGGETLEDFLEGFPTVSRALAISALEEAKDLLLARTS